MVKHVKPKAREKQYYENCQNMTLRQTGTPARSMLLIYSTIWNDFHADKEAQR